MNVVNVDVLKNIDFRTKLNDLKSEMSMSKHIFNTVNLKSLDHMQRKKGIVSFIIDLLATLKQ